MNPQDTGFLVPPGAIVNQIQTLLSERYKEGFPIIKEILQNANDGGATRLDIGVTSGFKDTSLHPKLRQPALFFVNNGSFRDEDSQAIGWIGVDFNAGNSSKIGKFGLGQKSVFHFCEEFFYVAFSNQLSEISARYRFLTPWADGSPMSSSDSLAVENYLKDIFLKEENNYSEYFILWLPLRSSNKPRSILPNVYDCNSIQEHFPSDAALKIGRLLPLLNALESVYYWTPDNQEHLIESFHVQIKSLEQRFSYPKPERIFCESNFHKSLSGFIQVQNSTKMPYAGIEATLSEDEFCSLIANIPEDYEDQHNFWSTLSNLANWPKRSTYDHTGKPEIVPDKAVPHCGAVFLRYPREEDETNSNLTLQWAVFLPLEETETNNFTHEAVPVHSAYQYTLVLHGYFFLDSGRRSIEGLSQIYNGKLNTAEPQNKDEMIQQWNLILATEGTLSQILPALELFSQHSDIQDTDIDSICSGLLNSKLLKQQALHPYLFQSGYWVYQVQPDYSQWQFVDHPRLLALPNIPNWKVWSGLETIATNSCFILKDKPNLIPENKPDQWNDDEILEILENLDILQVFQNSNELHFLINWIEIIFADSPNEELSIEVQDCLQNNLRLILIQSNWEELREDSKKYFLTSAVSRLNKSRWFCLNCFDGELLKYLNEVQGGVLLLSQDLFPEYARNTLSSDNAAILVSGSAQYRRQHPKPESTNFISDQIVQAVPEDQRSLFREQIKNISFIPGYNCRRNKSEFYSLDEIKDSNNFIFRDSPNLVRGENRLAKALQNALAEKDVILIDLELARQLCSELAECNYGTCFRYLSQHPRLANPSNRIDLLKRLLQGDNIRAIRFLLHGDPERYPDQNSLYIASQSNPVWSKVARFILEAWQTVPQELAEAIPQDQWERLKISPISPESLIKDLDPSQLNPQNFTPEERQEILNQVSAYGTRELWRSLPLHIALNGEIVSITNNTYLSNPSFALPAQLEHYVVLIERTNRPDWIQRWEPKAAIVTILDLPNPDRYCNLLLSLIPQVPEIKSDDNLFDKLTTVPWLPLATEETVEPSSVILLPNLLSPFEDELKEVFASESKCSYVSPLMLDKNIQGSQSLKIVCLNWNYTDVFKFLLEEIQKPSNHVLLILKLLTTLENKQQNPSNQIPPVLTKTKWLLDSKGGPRSPEQIINLPTLEDTVKKILSESNPQQYISLSMLREDINLLESKLTPKWFTFTSGEDAFEKLGEIVESQPKHYLGKLDPSKLWDTRALVQGLYSTLRDCEQTFILALAQDLDAFNVFIFERLLNPIDDYRKVIAILNYLIENNSKPNKTVIQIFNVYLRIACEFNEFGSSILPEIKLLDQNQKWKSPEFLCDGDKNHNIDPEYLLDSNQKNILSTYLNQYLSSLGLPVRDTEDSISFPISSNSEKLEEYFKPWLQYVPSQAIGGIIGLLSGEDHNILQLAQSFLQRRPVKDLRRELLFGQHRSKAFNIQINEGKSQSVQSILGGIFDAPVLDSNNVETIFLGAIDSNLSLRKIELQNLNKDKVKNLLFQSFLQLMRSFDKDWYAARKSLIENIWHRLNISEQIEVEVAKDFILCNSKYLLRSLGIRNSQIREKLKLWDDKEFALSDWRRKSHKNKADFERLTQEIEEIADSIGNLIQLEENQIEILDAVCKKIGEGQYGYHESNIPFEIFQNADDAVKELEIFSNDIELERRYFVLEYSSNHLTFIHWGRPINKFCYPGHQDQEFSEKGFEQDLIKMLSFNISDKGEDETGKFGLGFKTVHLITSNPLVLSGDLSFTVCGGILPLLIRDLSTLDNLRTQLDNECLSPELTDGTIISLPLQEDCQNKEIIQEFEKQTNLLLVFAKAIRRCRLVTSNYTKDLDWSPELVFDIPGIEIGHISLLNVSSQWTKYRLLNFRLNSGSVAILLTQNLQTDNSPLKDLATFWVTTPTKEGSGLRFIINGDFDVTTGRTSLDPNSSKNQETIRRLGLELADKLDSLFQASTGDNWSSLERILDIGSIERYQFWDFLWNVLARDWLSKSSDSRANDLIKSGFSGISQGIAHVINTRRALPNDLSNHLVCVQEINYQVCGLLAENTIFSKVSSWDSFEQHYPCTSLINQTVWKSVKKLWGSDPLEKLPPLYLADCLREELGDRNVDPKVSSRIGQIINPEKMKDWGSTEKYDYQKIIDVLQSTSINFTNQVDGYLSAPLLLLYEPKDPEEKRLVAFAPTNRILNSDYTDTGLEFFRVCRSQRETVSVEELVKWARSADTEEKRQGVRKYLSDGEQSLKFADKLQDQISGTWMENDRGINSLLKTKDIQEKQNRALQGEISWDEIDSDPSPPPPPVDPPQASPQLLSKIYEWWQKNCAQETAKYNKELYPLAIEEFQELLRQEDRSAWLILFFIGATHTMGRTMYQQHRDFIHFCSQKGWLETFASPDPETRPEEWMKVLDDYIDPQVQETPWFYWMERFTTIYRIAKYLDEYRKSFLALEKFNRDFDLQSILATRASSTFSGGGIDAPPQRLGIGANFVVRELVRFEIIQLNDVNQEFIIPHCFLPKAKVRKVFKHLGCPDLDAADHQNSKKIFKFTKQHLGNKDITFKKSFDIPFQLYSEIKNIESISVQPDYE